MSNLHRNLPWWIAPLAALVLGPTPTSGGSAAVAACAGGPGAGRWVLPSVIEGVVDGRLFDAASGQPRYTFVATLFEQGAACPECMLGLVYGYLDDGIGPAPDYLVRGWYSGTFFGGTGGFVARVLRPNGGPAVGGIQGRFGDPPFDGLPGRFEARWEICP